MDIRIICIGNSFFPPDTAGPMVFELLSRLKLPENVELIDGGLAGLDLLRFLEGVRIVIFVDAVSGFRESPGIVILDTFDSLQIDADYDHNTGLSYLLQVAPLVLSGDMPLVVLVGIEGEPEKGLCTLAAQTCLDIIAGHQQ
jgi:hydrogenase maturation protease